MASTMAVLHLPGFKCVISLRLLTLKPLDVQLRVPLALRLLLIRAVLLRKPPHKPLHHERSDALALDALAIETLHLSLLQLGT
jgi:hypothetical protein